MSNENDQFTLIILTFNRYSFLTRLLTFYNLYDFPFQIHVLDSSDAPMVGEDLIELLNHENISHRRFEPDISLCDKICQGVSCLSTPYAALCADDDFIVPQSIIQCVRFLAQNQDYSCCQGMIVHHLLKKSANEQKIALIPNYYKAKSNEYALSHERLFAYLGADPKAGAQHFYAVFRSELLKTIWLQVQKYNCGQQSIELLAGGLSMIYGKRKWLPIFYSSRESHNYNPFAGEMAYSFPQDENQKYVEGFTQHLMETEGLQYEIARRYAGLSYLCYRKKNRKTLLAKNAQSSIAAKFVIKLSWLRNSIMMNLHRFLYAWRIKRKTSVFTTDFERMKKLVISMDLGGHAELNDSRRRSHQKMLSMKEKRSEINLDNSEC